MCLSELVRVVKLHIVYNQIVTLFQRKCGEKKGRQVKQMSFEFLRKSDRKRENRGELRLGSEEAE
jgi:hypothetical protein